MILRNNKTWEEDLKDGPKLVDGFAFEIPGWPEFHCCVRFGNRWGDDLFDDWIIDHYETGDAISKAGILERKEDAPTVMRRVLDEIGREVVHERLRHYQCIHP